MIQILHPFLVYCGIAHLLLGSPPVSPGESLHQCHLPRNKGPLDGGSRDIFVPGLQHPPTHLPHLHPARISSWTIGPATQEVYWPDKIVTRPNILIHKNDIFEIDELYLQKFLYIMCLAVHQINSMKKPRKIQCPLF